MPHRDAERLLLRLLLAPFKATDAERSRAERERRYTMDGRFFLIIANFRDDRLNDVEKGLERLGVERLNICKVRGFGEYHNNFAQNWLAREVRVEIFTKEEEVEAVVSTIMEAAHTGVPGDGVVAVLPIDKLYLIRTRHEATPEEFWPKAGPQRTERRVT
jgi:nitrogen regulatory protein P-II 1